MNLLREYGSVQIKEQAFYIFKIMTKELISDPQRYVASYKIVCKNRERLVKHFQKYGDEGEIEFQVEKEEVIHDLSRFR